MKLLSILLLGLSLGSVFAVLNNRRAAVEETSTPHTEESLQAAGYQYFIPSAQHGVQYQAPAISHPGNGGTFAIPQDHAQPGGGYATQQPDIDDRPTAQAEAANYGFAAGENYQNYDSADNAATSDHAAPAIQQIPFQAQYQAQEQQQEYFQNGGFLQHNNHFETQAPIAPAQYTDSISKLHHNAQSSLPQPYPQQNTETNYATAAQSAPSAAPQSHLFQSSPGQPFPSFAANGHYPYSSAVGSFAAQTSALSAAAYFPAHFSVAAVPAVSTTTPAAPAYSEGQKGLGHYSYAVNRPIALEGGIDYKQSQPTSQLLTGELTQNTQGVRGDGFEYLQMQSNSYELPSYFTMHSDATGLDAHQQNYQQQQAPYSSYLPPAAAHSEQSYAAPGHQPQSFYEAPPTAIAAYQQQPPNRAFQAPYYK